MAFKQERQQQQPRLNLVFLKQILSKNDAAICGCCSKWFLFSFSLVRCLLINSFVFPQTTAIKPKSEMIENVLKAKFIRFNTKWHFITILLLFIHRFAKVAQPNEKMKIEELTYLMPCQEDSEK